MWIGSLLLEVKTGAGRQIDGDEAGTDSLVIVHVLRDGNVIADLRVDFPTENDLEAGTRRGYAYYFDRPFFHRTQPLPDGVGQNPMPYPRAGIEMSQGIPGHLVLQFEIKGKDAWLKDEVAVYAREYRRMATSFDTVAWALEPDWRHIGTFGRDQWLSSEGLEGPARLNLTF